MRNAILTYLSIWLLLILSLKNEENNDSNDSFNKDHLNRFNLPQLSKAFSLNKHNKLFYQIMVILVDVSNRNERI